MLCGFALVCGRGLERGGEGVGREVKNAKII